MLKSSFLGGLIFLLLNSCVQENNTNDIIYKPIGYFKTDFNINKDVPRQGILSSQSQGKIVISEGYGEALLDLDKFEYIWVIYHMNLVEDWDPFVNPPGTEHYFGTFATRSPRRPNSIGMALTRLNRIDHDTLFVSGIDAFNNTPVLDLKPYLPSIDFIESKINIDMEREMGHHDEIMVEKDKAVYK
ncbi:MAG: tRNA (N6-threonylcarbamoyladenosine(37)-N6)-methyltransferase TrmO [Flavobacteriales bacterium]|nr:tRNA (N6-threonylcarbamoyladenosine(37)-N6)-methyltransferase TrmO [Flavobacteriales bacterium]